MKKILLYFAIMLAMLFTLTNCKTKQPIVESETIIKRDTVYIEKIKTVAPPQQGAIVIEKPCDSAGILKNFNQTLKVSGAKVNIRNSNGNISATVNVDSIVQEKIREYKESAAERIKIVPQPYEVEKDVILWKPILIMAGIILVLLVVLFSSLKKFIPNLLF